MISVMKPPRRQEESELLRWGLVSAFSLLVLARVGVIVSRGVQPIVDILTFDDAYYYLNTAWTHKESGLPSFDGYNRTNGVQFLYYWLLFGWSHLFSDRYAFLVATLWLCGALAAFAVPLAYLAARKLGLTWGALLASASIDGLILKSQPTDWRSPMHSLRLCRTLWHQSSSACFWA